MRRRILGENEFFSLTLNIGDHISYVTITVNGSSQDYTKSVTIKIKGGSSVSWRAHAEDGDYSITNGSGNISKMQEDVEVNVSASKITYGISSLHHYYDVCDIYTIGSHDVLKDDNVSLRGYSGDDNLTIHMRIKSEYEKYFGFDGYNKSLKEINVTKTIKEWCGSTSNYFSPPDPVYLYSWDGNEYTTIQGIKIETTDPTDTSNLPLRNYTFSDAKARIEGKGLSVIKEDDFTNVKNLRSYPVYAGNNDIISTTSTGHVFLDKSNYSNVVRINGVNDGELGNSAHITNFWVEDSGGYGRILYFPTYHSGAFTGNTASITIKPYGYSKAPAIGKYN